MQILNQILIACLLFTGLNQVTTNTEETNSETLVETLDTLQLNVQNKTLDLQTELKATLKRIEGIVELTYSSIDEQTLRNAWREGLGVDKDIEFEKDITFYQMKSVYDAPCKSINFLFGIKSDFEIFKFNAERFMLCFLKYYDEIVKEFLSDLVVEGTINIVKSGSSNPISTFFTNILIIEGPLKLKDELFGALYKYIDENPELNVSYKILTDILVKLAFDNQFYAAEIYEFKRVRCTSMLFFFYDMIIIYMEDNDVYLSAYDFIQPESNLVTNLDSMNPKFVSDKYMDILEEDLNRFKQIKLGYKENGASTVYHKTYAMYVDKNIQILCNYLYKKEDC